MKTLSLAGGLFLICFNLSCAKYTHTPGPANAAGEEAPPITSPDEGNPAIVPAPKPGDNSDIPLAICSNLSFQNVTWPADFQVDDRNSMALALNVSGSYEGTQGWANLTNNFDGQGFSMGLLQQNLGQGSIQPLLLRMRDFHRDVLRKYMTPAMLQSMEVMLAEWEKAVSLLPHDVLESTSDEVEPDRELIQIQESADEGLVEKIYAVRPFALLPHNQKSVDWAVKTIFLAKDGKKFKPRWEKALKSIAADPAYISLQIHAARHLHDRAYGYQQRLGFTELRGYLFLFDISVQNGTLKEKHFDKFFAWLNKNPHADEEAQMLELLEIRVVDSNPIWQDDVRRRKQATIRGYGVVHGKNRDLQREFCYTQTDKYP